MKKLTFRIYRGECFAQRGGMAKREGHPCKAFWHGRIVYARGFTKKPFRHGCMTDELRACALSTVLRPQNGNAPHSLLIAGGAGRWRDRRCGAQLTAGGAGRWLIGGAERY